MAVRTYLVETIDGDVPLPYMSAETPYKELTNEDKGIYVML